MKYIRTKDGVYRNASSDDEIIIICRDRKAEVNPIDITNQADTIEELCDGFIGVADKEWFRKNCVATKGVSYFQKPFELEYRYFKKDFANLKLKNQNGWEYTAIEWQRDRHEFIFGYIETDKGLIYVAKMNDEGELELL